MVLLIFLKNWEGLNNIFKLNNNNNNIESENIKDIFGIKNNFKKEKELLTESIK